MGPLELQRDPLPGAGARHLDHRGAGGEGQHHATDGRDLPVDPRAPERAPGPAAPQPRRCQPLRVAGARGLAPGAQHAARPGRRRAGSGAAPGRGEHLDRGASEAVRPPPAQRPAAGRRLQPRAGEPRVAGRPDPRPGAGERSRDGDGSDDARVRRRLGRARQRRRRPRDRRHARATRRSGGRSALHPAARLAQQGRGAGLLRRLLQRGALAALPHRAHAADLPAGRLGLLPRGEPEVRRHRAGPDQGRRVAARPHPGLSLRAAVGAHQGRASRRPRRHLLAHPVAQLRGVRDLSVAARAAPRACSART